MSTYFATDISGPCFSYEKVVAAALPIMNTPQSPAPLYFCRAMPFNIGIPLVKALGPGCDGKNLCWASGQQVDHSLPEGPYLTEWTLGGASDRFPTHIVPDTSAYKAVYAFQQYQPSPADGYTWMNPKEAIILIYAVQPNGSSGYLVIDPEVTGDSVTPLYATKLVTLDEAIKANVQWGVIGRNVQDLGAANTCILMYYDKVLCGLEKRALPLMQAFSWQNGLYFSRGTAATGSSGTYAAFHGVTKTQYSDFSPSVTFTNDNFQYDPTTLIAINSYLPQFDATNPDNGALNFSWSLELLPISSLSANVYSETYCEGLTSTGCRNGAPECTQWVSQGPAGIRCQAVRTASPTKDIRATAQACSDPGALHFTECRCLNATLTKVPEPTLYNSTYTEFMQWLQGTGLSSLNVLATYPPECWWPSCTTANPDVLPPRPNPACVPEVTSPCVQAIQKLSAANVQKLDANTRALCEYRDPQASNAGGWIAMWIVVGLGIAAILAVAIYFGVKAAKDKRESKKSNVMSKPRKAKKA